MGTFHTRAIALISSIYDEDPALIPFWEDEVKDIPFLNLPTDKLMALLFDFWLESGIMYKSTVRKKVELLLEEYANRV